MRWRRPLVLSGLLLLVLCMPASGQAIDWTGAWVGTFGGPGAAPRAGAPGGQLEVVLRVERGAGGWVGRLDIPVHGVFDADVRVEMRADTLTFDVGGLGAAFAGVRSDDGRRGRIPLPFRPARDAVNPDRVAGVWTQAGGLAGLTLVRTSADPARRRWQEPTTKPYAEEQVAFTSADGAVRLEGTLALPSRGGRAPAVVLISGSGPHDRDGAMAGHRPFVILSDHLVRLGVAVLRYDERGVGRSTGDFATATSADFADDVLAAVRFLADHVAIDPARIGLVGHSEGGMVAPMVANRSDDVSFLVLLAAPGLPLADVSLQQSEAILRAEGRPEAEIETSVNTARRLMHLVAGAEHADEVVASARAILLEALAPLGLPAELLERQLGTGVERFTSPWMQFAARHDPRAELRRIRNVPVLALNGTLDVQVLSAPNLMAIRDALKEGGSTHVTIAELNGLNHLFQPALTGAPSEYGLIDETFAPAALDIIGDWITSVVAGEGARRSAAL